MWIEFSEIICSFCESWRVKCASPCEIRFIKYASRTKSWHQNGDVSSRCICLLLLPYPIKLCRHFSVLFTSLLFLFLFLSIFFLSPLTLSIFYIRKTAQFRPMFILLTWQTANYRQLLFNSSTKRPPTTHPLCRYLHWWHSFPVYILQKKKIKKLQLVLWNLEPNLMLKTLSSSAKLFYIKFKELKSFINQTSYSISTLKSSGFVFYLIIKFSSYVLYFVFLILMKCVTYDVFVTFLLNIYI